MIFDAMVCQPRRAHGAPPLPWLEMSDRPTVRAWAQLEILSDMVYEDLRQRGVLNEEGQACRLLDDYRKLRATQVILSRELGMTPAARMAIKAGNTNAALDIVSLMAGQTETGESLEAVPADNSEPETR
jgi:hypothetical protein